MGAKNIRERKRGRTKGRYWVRSYLQASIGGFKCYCFESQKPSTILEGSVCSTYVF